MRISVKAVAKSLNDRAFTGENIGALKETVRVLRPRGRLVIETGWAVPVAQVRAAMSEAGFHYVRCQNIYAKAAQVGEVRKSFVRLTGRLRTRCYSNCTGLLPLQQRALLPRRVLPI